MEFTEYVGRVIVAVGRELEEDELAVTRACYNAGDAVRVAIDAIKGENVLALLEIDDVALRLRILNDILSARNRLAASGDQFDRRSALVAVAGFVVAEIEDIDRQLDRYAGGSTAQFTSTEGSVQVSFATEGNPADVKADIERAAAKQNEGASEAASKATMDVIGAINAYVDTLPPSEPVSISVTFGIYHKAVEKVASA